MPAHARDNRGTDLRHLRAARVIRAERQRIAAARPDAILCIDETGTIVLTTDGADSLFGYAPHALVGRAVSELVPEHLRELHGRHLQAYFRNPHDRPMGSARGLFARRADGSEFPADITLTVSRQDGELTVAVVVRDIGEQVEAVHELRRREEHWRANFEHAPAALLDIDESLHVSSANRAAQATLGQPCTGRSLFDLVHPDDHASLSAALEVTLAGLEDVATECRLLTAAPDPTWFTLQLSRFRGGGAPRHAVIALETLPATVDEEQLAMLDARREPRAVLAGRHRFEARLQHLLAGGGQQRHVLVVVAIDQYKVVNATCGHVAGDVLLKEVAAVIEEHTRKSDYLASIEAGEFAIAMEGCDVEQARTRMAGVIAALQDFRLRWDDYVFSVRPSVGIVDFAADGEGVAELLRKASMACQVAKGHGAGQQLVHGEDDVGIRSTHRDLHWGGRLQRALDEDRFELWGQPLAPLRNDASLPHILEVLVRLRDQDGELVMPGTFLPAAERFGLAPQLDLWVTRRAIRWLCALPAHIDICCAINLSGLSVCDRDFTESVLALLEDSAVDARRLIFEITETAAVADFSAAMRCLDRLGGKGCRFALDDFGSGMSSFGYLKRLPFEFIKIDGFFIRELKTSEFDRLIVKTICDIGHALGKRVVAEFVESSDVVNELYDIGVDYAQGYAIARPMALEDLRSTLR